MGGPSPHLLRAVEGPGLAEHGIAVDLRYLGKVVGTQRPQIRIWSGCRRQRSLGHGEDGAAGNILETGRNTLGAGWSRCE